MMMITADGSARRSITLLLLDDYYSQVIIICGCDDESLWLSPTLYRRSVCRICVAPARSLRPRLMGVPSRDPLGLSLPSHGGICTPSRKPHCSPLLICFQSYQKGSNSLPCTTRPVNRLYSLGSRLCSSLNRCLSSLSSSTGVK